MVFFLQIKSCGKFYRGLKSGNLGESETKNEL
jgi:hypothetical protein